MTQPTVIKKIGDMLTVQYPNGEVMTMREANLPSNVINPFATTPTQPTPTTPIGGGASDGQPPVNYINPADPNYVDITKGNATSGTDIYDTGNEELNAVLKGFQDTLSSIINSGKIINPKIDITPARLAELTSQVAGELDPYYKSQFEAIKEDLSTDLSHLSEQYKQSVSSQEASFRQNLAAQREAEAERGLTFSGGRKTREQELAEAAQRSMGELTSNLGYQAQKAGTTAERNIGSLGLGGLPSTTYAPTTVSTQGKGGYIPLESRSLYSPTGGITGTLEREQIEKKRSYLDLLKGYELNKLNV